MKIIAKYFIFILFSLPFILANNSYAYLPNSAYSLPIAQNIPVGSIIVETVVGYMAATGASDESFVGVLVEQADFVYITGEDSSNRPVVSTGIVPMRLKNSMGQIVKGDSITFSKTEAGVGVEAQGEDIIIATALETVNGETTQLKPVQIAPINTKGNIQSPKDDSTFAQELTNLLKATNSRMATGETNPALYLLAIIVVILGSIFGFILFGRIAINGIEAIGRNPLAKSSIIQGILINTAMVIIFMIGTILAAAFIIR